MIYLTSDLHFCHNRDFLYSPRGFHDAGEMNHTIVSNWNHTVKDDDEVYVLGDMMLNDDAMVSILLSNCAGAYILFVVITIAIGAWSYMKSASMYLTFRIVHISTTMAIIFISLITPRSHLISILTSL